MHRNSEKSRKKFPKVIVDKGNFEGYNEPNLPRENNLIPQRQ
jgi:hypothetical protein